MRRDLAVLLATLAAVAMILGGTFLLPAAERAMRHLDVKISQPELPSPAALLSGYSTVFSVVLSGDYSNASELISYLNSSYVPESMRYIFGRFNSLFASVVSDMNQTGILIKQAREALGVGMLAEAKVLAGNASVSLWRANSTASQLRDSSATLAPQLKVPQIRTGLSSIDARIAYLAQALSEVRSEISMVESGEMARTQITIALDRAEVWVGSTVTASGFLVATESGSPIADAAVSVVVEGASSVYSAVTRGDGSYSVTFPVPFIYGEHATVQAYFPASGGYAGSSSADVRLRLLWLQPDLEATLNVTRAKPGEWILVSGTTGLAGSHGERVLVSAFGSSYTVDPSEGAFSAAFQIPAKVPSGRNTINVSVVPSGIVGPDSSKASLEVYRLPTAVTISLPSVSISGTTMTVSGKVVSASDGKPMSGANVSISVSSSGVYTCVSGEDGAFEVDVPIGLVVPTGWIEVSATAYPAAAAYQQSSVSSGFYSVNPSIAAVPVAALTLAYGTVRRSGRVAKVGFRKPSVLVGQHFEEGRDGKTRTGAMSAVVSAYHKAAAAFGDFLGSALGRSETMREFLGRVSGKTGSAATEPFLELTRMAEEELYAGRVQEAAKAAPLLQSVLSFLSAVKDRISGVSGSVGEADGSVEGNAVEKGAGNRGA